MMSAQHSRQFAKLFHLYNRQLLHRRFEDIYVRGPSPSDGPLLVYGNHTSWWDGLILFHLNQTIWKRNLHVLMSSTGLERYPLFRRLGAFSMDERNAVDVRRALRYAARALREPNTMLAWFPQGQELHSSLRPLEFQPGIGELLRLVYRQSSDVSILPMAMRYEFLECAKPEVFVSFGSPMSSQTITAHSGGAFSGGAITMFLEDELTQIMDDLEMDIRNWRTTDRLRRPGFHPLSLTVGRRHSR